MNTVIFHNADYDGIFCREIARHFLGDNNVTCIGWNFGDKPLQFPVEGVVYVMDLPVDRVFGIDFGPIMANMPGAPLLGNMMERLVWIDHHRSSIESHPASIDGYRIDGVAACRLAWQWFNTHFPFGSNYECEIGRLPTKQEFLDRKVTEPLAVLLAGEYDIWDHRGDGDVEFQFGLDSKAPLNWDTLLSTPAPDGTIAPDAFVPQDYVRELVSVGKTSMTCYAKRDADIMRERSFLLDWEGLRFLCLNTARCNSNTFAFRDIPETRHDALLAFYFQGKAWVVSLYHAKHRTDLDLSKIAVKYGGGGHKGACGFTCGKLPFLNI